MDYMFYASLSFKRKLSGAAWVHSKASQNFMFEGSSGSISRAVYMLSPAPVTTFVTHQYVTRRPLLERELVVHTPTIASVSTSPFNTPTCPKCGTFEKSGRVSCCAPGGAWFKNCGGAGNRNVDHRWFEGMQACKRKFKANGCRYILAQTK